MVCMIDWVTAQVACDYQGAITGGQILMVDGDGVLDWRKDRWREVSGSHSSKLLVQGLDDGRRGCRLYVSGNLAKFLQGHNLFGSGDINYLVASAMEKVCDILKLPASDNDRASWAQGLYILSRVDVTRMYDLGAPDRVKEWLVSAAQVAHSRYQPAGNQHASTLYIGKNSRRVSTKFYNKAEEMQVKGHRLPDTLRAEWYHQLEEWAVGKLRAEGTFRSMWLKDYGRALGAAWSSDYADRLLDERLGAIEMSDTMKLTDEYIGELPGRLALVYEAWRNGRDLRSMYKKSYFYQLRRELLAYNVDIAHVRPREVVTENQYLMGAPLKSFLSKERECEVPSWAKGTPLYADAG